MEKAFETLSSSPFGLTQKEAQARLSQYGKNALKEKPPAKARDILLSQFKSPLICVLLVVGIIALGIGHHIDAVGIFLAVALAVLSGFVQEYKAERSIDALRKMEQSMARVLRDKKEYIIPSSEIVPGDVMIFSEGEKLPADARIIEAINLACDESLLTGESVPAVKSEAQLKEAQSLSDMKNIVFARTAVVRGRGKAVAFATGQSTEFGKVAQTLAQTAETQTPLQKKMDELGRKISAYVILLAIAYLAIGVLLGADFEQMFIVAIVLVVMAVPEGLPTIMAITLAIGMQNMAKKNALIRKLPAVEALGSTTIICTDKTGTLTKNKLTVRRISLPGGDYEITDTGSEFEGNFVLDGKREIGTLHSRLEKLVEISVMCNNASIVESAQGERMAGDPTEGALLAAAKKFGYDIEGERQKTPLSLEIPFSSERKMMSVGKAHEGKNTIYVKGALEVMLPKCKFILAEGGVREISSADILEINKKNNQMGESAMRILAAAYKEAAKFPSTQEQKGIESSLIYVGLIAMMDPPRAEVYGAVQKCRSAGIRIMMITGDGKKTAFAIARELRISSSEAEVLEGFELDGMDDKELSQRLKGIKVIARASPHHKYRAVSLLMAQGESVAVTGDGVNDAPAIKKANIGISMGIAGTDVAKEVSDMILTDDNFATIVTAVEYGRRIYDNIKSFVRYQFSTNAAALLTMFSAQFLGLGLPMTVLQMLWINIIMDGPPAVALGFEPAAADTMQRKPRDPGEPFVTRNLITSILFNGAAMAAGTVAVFAYYLQNEPVKAGTVAFTTFVAFQLANALNCKSRSQSIFGNLLSNKYLFLAIIISISLQLAMIYLSFFQQYFQTVSLSLSDWTVIVGAAALILVFEEIKKKFFKGQTEY
ncbi:hypothetical protein AUJ17_02920 [Candidatus Micrarchaeota archaeon CG1_02_47_40]|nr:MAG: hypothetical protein AUJ17_02920 [Candidatus Micrarchaeota archaeon CG1_02_47_40]